MRRAHALPRFERSQKFDALGSGEQLDREHALGVRQHLPGLEPGGVSHRDVILLPRAGRDRVDARRVTQRLVLADEGGGDVLRDHEAGVETPVRREEGGQAVGQVRIHEPFDAALRDVRQLRARHRERVESEREGLSVEVSVRHE